MRITVSAGEKAGIIGLLTLQAQHQVMGCITAYEPLIKILEMLDIPHKKELMIFPGSELLFSIHGRSIIPKEILDELPCYNIHPYLYKYKGAYPIRRAIKDKCWKASVGVHKMTEKIDCGKVLGERFVTVKGRTEGEIYNELYPYYVMAIIEAVTKISSSSSFTQVDDVFYCALPGGG